PPPGRPGSPPAAVSSPAPAATATSPDGPGSRTRPRTAHPPATGPAGHGPAPPAAAAAYRSTWRRSPRRSADPAPARRQAACTWHTRFCGRDEGTRGKGRPQARSWPAPSTLTGVSRINHQSRVALGTLFGVKILRGRRWSRAGVAAALKVRPVARAGWSGWWFRWLAAGWGGDVRSRR